MPNKCPTCSHRVQLMSDIYWLCTRIWHKIAPNYLRKAASVTDCEILATNILVTLFGGALISSCQQKIWYKYETNFSWKYDHFPGHAFQFKTYTNMYAYKSKDSTRTFNDLFIQKEDKMKGILDKENVCKEGK